MQNALNHLQKADNDNGGQRKKGIELVREAIEVINKGIAYDRKH